LFSLDVTRMRRLFFLLTLVLATYALAAEKPRMSAVDASKVAAQFANDDCQRRFGISPFKPSAGTPSFSDGRWHWKAISGYGRGDLIADISFTEDGLSRSVRVDLTDSRRGLRYGRQW
jgi:hypothetical protein